MNNPAQLQALQVGRGNLETGDKRSLTLFENKYDAQDLRKNGNPAGRLLLININSRVHTKAAHIEVDFVHSLP